MVKERAGSMAKAAAVRPAGPARPCCTLPRVQRERPLITVLSVSGNQQDHDTVRRMIDSGWSLRQSLSLAAARDEMRANRFAILLCDDDSMPGVWKHLQADRTFAGNSPFVVVASRLADASLWAEALNLGAWDVLAKPLDEEEVSRVLGVALTRWKGQSGGSLITAAASG